MTSVQSHINTVWGYRVAGIHAGLKKNGALDLALVVSERPCTAAGVFTKNQMKAAPVLLDMERLRDHSGHIRAIAVNTRCANACTGQQGLDNAHRMANQTAQHVDCAPEQVLVMSTGVIGAQLDMAKIEHGLALAAQHLGDDWNATAHAIMTTDTR